MLLSLSQAEFEKLGGSRSANIENNLLNTEKSIRDKIFNDKRHQCCIQHYSESILFKATIKWKLVNLLLRMNFQFKNRNRKW